MHNQPSARAPVAVILDSGNDSVLTLFQIVESGRGPSQMRGEPEVIGPKYAVRFSDLSGWHRIEVRCFSCEHVHKFDPEGLKRLRIRQLQRKHRRSGMDEARLREEIQHQRVAELETLLRCSRCGNRLHNSMRIVKLPRDP